MSVLTTSSEQKDWFGSEVGGIRGTRIQILGRKLKPIFLKSQKLFLKSWKLFLKSQKLFLNSQGLFLKSQKLFLKSWKLFLKYFLNPRNYFLIWAPNPETIYKTRIAFTNPNHWTRIAVNHLKSRDCPRQVSHVLTERERLPRRHPSFCFVLCSFCFVLCSLTPHLRISHCFFLTFQSVRSFNMS